MIHDRLNINFQIILIFGRTTNCVSVTLERREQYFVSYRSRNSIERKNDKNITVREWNSKRVLRTVILTLLSVPIRVQLKNVAYFRRYRRLLWHIIWKMFSILAEIKKYLTPWTPPRVTPLLIHKRVADPFASARNKNTRFVRAGRFRRSIVEYNQLRVYIHITGISINLVPKQTTQVRFNFQTSVEQYYTQPRIT